MSLKNQKSNQEQKLLLCRHWDFTFKINDGIFSTDCEIIWKRYFWGSDVANRMTNCMLLFMQHKMKYKLKCSWNEEGTVTQATKFDDSLCDFFFQKKTLLDEQIKIGTSVKYSQKQTTKIDVELFCLCC